MITFIGATILACMPSHHELFLDMVVEANVEREMRGLAPLVIDETLMDGADINARKMARESNLRHLPGPYSGEIIASGQPSVRGAITSWLNSPGHRALLLSPRFGKVGAAVYRTKGTSQRFYCMQFGG